MRTMLLVRRWLKLIFCGGGGTVFLEEGNSTISYTTIRSSSTCKKSDFLISCYARRRGEGHKSGDFPFSSPPSPPPLLQWGNRRFWKDFVKTRSRPFVASSQSHGRGRWRAPPKVAVSHRGGKEGSGRAQVEKKFTKTLWVYETLQ